MQIAKRYQDELPRLKKNVKNSFDYFKSNYNRYHMFRKFVFETSLSDTDIALLTELKKPQLQFNVLESYISRLRGEFSKQEPSINVESSPDGNPTDPATIAVVEGHFRSILNDANKDSFEYNIYTDLLSGGFSVIKVWTEYANERSFNQIIKLGRVSDPTLCGFDINAQKTHKGDGQYCFENYPKTVDEFRDEFGNFDLNSIKFSKDLEGFTWSYRNANNEDILLVSDYYEKKEKKTKIVQLANGQVMTTDEYEQFIEKWTAAGIIQQPPVASRSRTSYMPVICRYQLIENQVINYTETDFRHLPRIFVDGNSVTIRDSVSGSVQQLTRPYVYHAKDQQRLINFAGQTLANELENMIQHKWKVAKESIPSEYERAYTDNQVPNVVVYNAYADRDQQVPLPPPQEVVRTPTPPEVTNTFMSGMQMVQSILGSYDAALGINDNQLSGVAIVEGATQSNAAAMPYVVGFLQGLTQAAVMCLDLIPKYFAGLRPRTIPIVRPDGKKSYVPINQQGGIFLNYQPNALNVNVEAGVNFAIQKSRALQQIIALCQASPLFAQFINQMGLEILLDNLEIRGIDQLKALAKKFMVNLQKMQAQQANQPNPLVMRQQLDQAKFQHQMQQDGVENQFRSAEIMNDANANTNDRLQILLDQQQAGVNDAVQIKKANAETYSKEVELALKAEDQRHSHTLEVHDQLHKHAHDDLSLAHQIQSSQQQQSEGVNQNG